MENPINPCMIWGENPLFSEASMLIFEDCVLHFGGAITHQLEKLSAPSCFSISVTKNWLNLGGASCVQEESEITNEKWTGTHFLIGRRASLPAVRW